MKLYTNAEIKQFMKSGAIYLEQNGENIVINDDVIDKKLLIASLKQLQLKDMEKDNFSDYNKESNGQKRKDKIRKKKK